MNSRDLPLETKIRAARISDFDPLIQLVEEYYQYDSLDFDKKRIGAALRKLLHDGNLGCAWLVEHGTEVAGYVLLTFNYDLEFGGYEGIVTDLFLREKFRRRGIGRLMIDRVEAHCRAAGISTLELQVEIENSAAHSFYHKLGFSRLPRLVMSRRIPPKN
jgi:GNAT superfamily N-acetyltransferase